MADSAEPGASCAAKAGGQIIANATSGTAALHGSTAACPYKLHEPAATGLFEFYDHPMESSARLWQLASSASGAKGAASGSLKDHAVPKGQLIARHSCENAELLHSFLAPRLSQTSRCSAESRRVLRL